MTHNEVADLAKSVGCRLAITIEPVRGSVPRVSEVDCFQVWKGNDLLFETPLFELRGKRFDGALSLVADFLNGAVA
jgi:hypothetical protein